MTRRTLFHTLAAALAWVCGVRPKPPKFRMRVRNTWEWVQCFGPDLTHPSNVDKAVAILSDDEINQEMWSIIERIAEEQGQGVGLSDFAYGRYCTTVASR